MGGGEAVEALLFGRGRNQAPIAMPAITASAVMSKMRVSHCDGRLGVGRAVGGHGGEAVGGPGGGGGDNCGMGFIVLLPRYHGSHHASAAPQLIDASKLAALVNLRDVVRCERFYAADPRKLAIPDCDNPLDKPGRSQFRFGVTRLGEIEDRGQRSLGRHGASLAGPLH
ncbi:hypothetical protein MBOT_25630 [Mycobacterium botniense]|uniref:Uncharacterized protein n=1 Tax=Mycobacterium botniense TaxID=84962 RepID=A0A7I9XZG7_9MYCO|nr:hypothetical protein MBOT_25630 [Mycobacterium botniense]